MSKDNSLISNVFFSAISWLSSLAYLLILILAARFLGDETYGQFAFAFAFSLIALLEFVANFGMKDYLVMAALAAARKRLQLTLVGK